MSYNPIANNRNSIRLEGYDYTKDGLYFITICSFKRKCLFGHIRDGEMILNDRGNIAHQCWLDIKVHYPSAHLHEHIVMPNHIHGILELGIVSNVFPNTPSQSATSQFQKVPSGSIGSIIRGFKIGVTTWTRNNSDIYQVWQRNYHDHIIRSWESYDKITNYIRNNPSTWQEDKFYVKDQLQPK